MSGEKEDWHFTDNTRAAYSKEVMEAGEMEIVPVSVVHLQSKRPLIMGPHRANCSLDCRVLEALPQMSSCTRSMEVGAEEDVCTSVIEAGVYVEKEQKEVLVTP